MAVSDDNAGILGYGDDEIASFRSENKPLFELAETLNKRLIYLTEFCATNVKESTWNSKAVAVRLLMRSCGLLQATILLSERGMIIEGRTIVRGLLEASFGVAALHDDAENYIDLLKSDSEASRKNQLKYLLDQQLIPQSNSAQKIQESIDNIKPKQKLINQKSIALMGPLASQYLAYQRLSDDSVHVTARSLNHYVKLNANGPGWHYEWLVGDRESVAKNLYTAILAALPIGLGVAWIIDEVAAIKDFSDLAMSFNKMEPLLI
jgi:hypothetical protein